MTNLSELLGDIQCYLAEQRTIQYRRWLKSHDIDDLARVDAIDDLSAGVREQLLALDAERNVA